MSIELTSRPEHSQEAPSTEPWVGEPEDGVARGVRLQAAEIIAAVLSDSSPGQAAARDQLCRLLHANPGRPEVALAEYLIALREEAGWVRQPLLHHRPTERVHYGRTDPAGVGGFSGDETQRSAEP